jgi:hypothetical protein
MTSIFNEYSALVGHLSEEEQDEVGRFAFELLTAKTAENKSKVEDLLKEAAEELDEFSDFETFTGLVGWLEKEAAAKPSSKKGLNNTLNNILAATGIVFAAAPAVALMAQWASRRSGLEKSKKQILLDYPALKDEPNFDRYFDMIASFAPQIAATPLLAGNVLESFRRLGPADITPQRLADLLALQGKITPISEQVNSVTTPLGKAIDVGANRLNRISDEDLAQKKLESESASRRASGPLRGTMRTKPMMVIKNIKYPFGHAVPLPRKRRP